MYNLKSHLDALKAINDRYEILGPVGAGGYSIVFKGRQLGPDRPVAIKLLRAALMGDEHSELRFKQESHVVANMSHPCIASVFDFGFLPNGQPYIVMEFLEGDTLGELIELGGEQVEDILQISIAVANGLHAAHQNGLVHRDVKPGNIFISKTPTGQSVKIIDFGLAKVVDSDAALSLTDTGKTLGTPMYMSPEQCCGQSLDRRSDIYSLGCVMYEALTGEKPFEADATYEWLHAHINGRPRPFSAFQKSRKLSQRLEAIVLKCMAKQPDDRYQDMLQLEQDLKYAASGLKRWMNPIERYHRWQAGKNAGARKGKERPLTFKPSYALAMGVAVLGCITCLLVSVIGLGVAGLIAVLFAPRSSQDAAKAVGVSQLTRLSRADPNNKAIAQALCRALLSQVVPLRRNGRWQEANDSLNQAQTIALKQFGPRSVEYAYVLLLSVNDDLPFPEKESRLLKAEKICETAGPKSEVRMYIYRALTSMYIDYEIPDKAVFYIEQALRCDREAERSDGLASDYSLLGRALYDKGLYQNAIDALKNTLTYRESQGLQNTLETASINELMGLAYGGVGDFARQEKHFTAALETLQNVAGPDSRATNRVRFEVGKMYMEARNTEKARQHLVRAQAFFLQSEPRGRIASEIEQLMTQR